MRALMKELDNAEPLPKDIKWVMRTADKNGDGNIGIGKMQSAPVHPVKPRAS